MKTIITLKGEKKNKFNQVMLNIVFDHIPTVLDGMEWLGWIQSISLTFFFVGLFYVVVWELNFWK